MGSPAAHRGGEPPRAMRRGGASRGVAKGTLWRGARAGRRALPQRGHAWCARNGTAPRGMGGVHERGRGWCARQRARAECAGVMAVGKMRTTCFEPYQAYWLELFFDKRKCNKIRLANRLTTRSRFGDAAHGQPVHKSLREKKAIPPKFAISITALFHKKVQNQTTTKQKRNCYGT